MANWGAAQGVSCVLPDCATGVPRSDPRQPLCDAHWERVPAWLRTEVWAAGVAIERHATQRAMTRYWRARRQAVEIARAGDA